MTGTPIDPGQLLGAPLTLRRREVSQAAGVSLLSARRFWRALGFPNVEDDVTAFTDADVGALHAITGLVRQGLLDEPTALGITRAVGRSADRLAAWQVQLLAEHVAGLAGGDAGADAGAGAGAGAGSDARDEVVSGTLASHPENAERTAELFARISGELEPLILYAWRRQVSSALARLAADAATHPSSAAGSARGSAPGSAPADTRDPASGDAEPRTVRAVGFADLVSFTRLVRRLTERDLARLVQRFELLTSDVVAAHGGRVVKTVGDEVLFASSPGPAAAAIALDIADTLAADDLLPDVRVGMSTGPVVSRLGDVFGTTVNRASRLTALAQPGTVLIDVNTVHSLAGVPQVEVRQLRGRTLRGLGHVVPWLLRRAGASPLD